MMDFMPGASAKVRAQVAREQARLLEMACSIEKASGTAGASVSIRAENERKLLEGQSARSLRPPSPASKFIAIAGTSPDSDPATAGDIETITGPLSQGKSVIARHTDCQFTNQQIAVNFRAIAARRYACALVAFRRLPL